MVGGGANPTFVELCFFWGWIGVVLWLSCGFDNRWLYHVLHLVVFTSFKMLPEQILLLLQIYLLQFLKSCGGMAILKNLGQASTYHGGVYRATS